ASSLKVRISGVTSFNCTGPYGDRRGGPPSVYHAAGAFIPAAKPSIRRPHLPGNIRPGVALLDERPPPLPHRGARRVVERGRLAERRRERRHADLGPPAAPALVELAPRRPGGGDRRHARRQRLGHDDPEVLAERRQYEQVGA